MPASKDLVAHIRNCEYLGLREIHQTYDGPLRIIVDERGRTGELQRVDKDIDIVAYPIGFPPNGAVFQLLWETYISFSVTGDDHPPRNIEIDPEYFQENSSTDFSRFILDGKLLYNPFDQPVKSWRIMTLENYIDVMSYSPIEITLL